MRYTGPKARRCRRHGTNLYGSDKYSRILQRKPAGPGKNPKLTKGRGKHSEYGEQLLEKQKVCAVYGVHDRQLQHIYSEATKKIGQTDQQMKTILERRIDNALYRAGFALTRLQARQFIAHGLFSLNGTRVTTPSIVLSIGQRVMVRPQVKQSPVFGPIVEAHERYVPPEWLKVDPSAMTFEVVSLPSDEHTFEQAIDMRKVVGFYSR